MRTIQFIILYAVVLLTFPFYLVQAKTIVVPDEAASVQEAVEMAVSGDEIVLSATEVNWTRTYVGGYDGIYSDPKGIRIVNKTVRIKGDNSSTPTRLISQHIEHYTEEENTMLWMEGSNVTFQNIEIEVPLRSRHRGGPNGGFTASPWIVESGSLTIENCQMMCWFICKGDLTVLNSTISGYTRLVGYIYTNYTLLDPAIQIGPADHLNIKIINSKISATTDYSYRNLVFENLHNSQVEIANSTIEGGTFQVGYGSYPGQYIYGSAAMEFSYSHRNTLHISNSQFFGGDGYDTTHHRFGEYYGGGEGGHGIKLDHCEITLKISGDTTICGGPGGDGLVQYDHNYYPVGPILSVEAGDGGSGISIEHSDIQIRNDLRFMEEIFSGGIGGSGMTFEGVTVDDGKPGEPISLDEYSAIVQASCVLQWELYE